MTKITKKSAKMKTEDQKKKRKILTIINKNINNTNITLILV